jgi:hypothetical protein
MNAYKEGQEAFTKGLPLHSVTYEGGTEDYSLWMRGWLDSADEEDGE